MQQNGTAAEVNTPGVPDSHLCILAPLNYFAFGAVLLRQTELKAKRWEGESQVFFHSLSTKITKSESCIGYMKDTNLERVTM